MKTIEEAAKEFLEKRQTAIGRKETGAYPPTAWFKAGVAFAQRWVSVEEELPKYGECVLIKRRGGLVDVAYSFDSEDKKRAIFWRPIELE